LRALGEAALVAFGVMGWAVPVVDGRFTRDCPLSDVRNASSR
jgi:hypothetical protein